MPKLTVILLAAGKGERLKPITETRPKPLVPILCKPLIDWQLEWLSRLSSAIDEVVVVVGEMRERVIERFRGRDLGVPVRFVFQERQLGTGDAVIRAVEGVSGDVLVVYGDVFLRTPEPLLRVAGSRGQAMLVARVGDVSNYGKVEAKDGKLEKILEKPQDGGPGLANAGVYKLGAEEIRRNSDVGVSPRGEVEFTDVVNKIARESDVELVEVDSADWVDVGYPWQLIEANKIALRAIAEPIIKGKVEEPAKIKGPVVLEEGAEVRAFTYVEGPAYIGRGASVGPSARLRPYSVICEGARVGFSVEVKESVIFENARVSHLSYIGDSIVCEGANLGAGTITANLRFDERTVKMRVKDRLVDTGRVKMGAVIGANVKTGVGVLIMPGVKIGSGSWIYPGAVVMEDVPPKTILKVQGKAVLSVKKDEHERR